MIDRRYENQVLSVSDRIITVGKSLKELFSSKIYEAGGKTDVITNGYDEDDFSALRLSTPNIFTVTYTGTLSDVYPIDGFLEALKDITKMNDFRLRFIGTVSSGQKDLILSKVINTKVDFIPYVDHTTAIKYMADSSVLLLIIPDHHSNKSIITGKLFEYIATGKPVICLGPVNGDAAEILNETGHGMTFSYTDSKGISDYLSSLISGVSFIEKLSPKAFSRIELTRNVISIIEKL
jgi:glycosyltransferase involved in cell wall biosynthesis